MPKKTKPATRKPGKVQKIIASPHPEIPEKAVWHIVRDVTIHCGTRI